MQHSFAKASANDAFIKWNTPDLSVLEEGRSAPPMILPALFGPCWPDLQRLAADRGSPVDYVALSFLTIGASLAGGKRKARPYSTSTWVEPLILWTGLVGDPSSNKSPALDSFVAILRKMEKERVEDHRATLGLWEADCERAKAERASYADIVKAAVKDCSATPPLPPLAIMPDAPKRRRFFVMDATPEAVGDVLSGNPQGLLSIRDELTGWLASFDRYNTGGRQFWIEAFGGRGTTVDRKGSPDPITSDYGGLCVVGGIQPAKLSDTLFNSSDDGLAARFLFTWPNRAPVTRPHSTANIGAFETTFRRLDDLAWGDGEDGECNPIIIPFDEDATDDFHRCREYYSALQDDASGLMSSFIGKLPGLAARLALASELSKWAWVGGPEPRSISRQTMEAVGDFVAAYAIPMAERVYGDAALSIEDRRVAIVAKHIRTVGATTVNSRDLMRSMKRDGLNTAATMGATLERLVEANWLRPNPTRRGGTVGRATNDYLVNPAIKEVRHAA